MKYYWTPFDDNHTSILFIFSECVPQRKILPEYEHLKCNKCGKIDELKALNIGVNANRNIRSRQKMFLSADNVPCVGPEVTQVLSQLKSPDFELVPLSTNGWHLIKPIRKIEVKDPANSGTRVYRPCSLCGRPKEAKRWPSRASLRWPRKDFDLALLKPSLEGLIGSMLNLIVSERVLDLLSKYNAKGTHTFSV